MCVTPASAVRDSKRAFDLLTPSVWNPAGTPNGRSKACHRCTVGAAEFAPPASGNTALFPTSNEFDVFSSPRPEVADPVVVQLVCGFSLGGVVDCAVAGPMINVPTRIAAVARNIFISLTSKH